MGITRAGRASSSWSNSSRSRRAAGFEKMLKLTPLDVTVAPRGAGRPSVGAVIDTLRAREGFVGIVVVKAVSCDPTRRVLDVTAFGSPGKSDRTVLGCRVGGDDPGSPVPFAP